MGKMAGQAAKDYITKEMGGKAIVAALGALVPVLWTLAWLTGRVDTPPPATTPAVMESSHAPSDVP